MLLIQSEYAVLAQALGGSHGFTDDLGIIVHEHDVDIRQGDQVSGVKNTTVDLSSIQKCPAGGILVDQYIFIIFMDNLSMETGEEFLLEDNVIPNLAAESRDRLRKGDHLLINDKKNALLIWRKIVGKVVCVHTRMVYPSYTLDNTGFPPFRVKSRQFKQKRKVYKLFLP
jgi:hypothetical protein